MADIHKPEVRSYNMSRIRSKDTKPEMIVRKYLHAKGYRFRLHVRDLPGKPDIVLPKYKTIIDIRGCFWHGHEHCKYGDLVKTESPIITGRITAAIARDRSNEQKWKSLGYKVIIIWDSCQLETKRKASEKRDKILSDLLNQLP